MYKKWFFVFAISLFIPLIGNGQSMNNDRLGKLLESVSDSITGVPGNWQFFVKDRLMICLTDENYNRMRIISPIAILEDVHEEELMACMEANFHSALDVKYAISEGVVWSVFIHPLRELSKGQAEDAVQQVYNAAATFGSTYNSTHLVFPKREEPEEEKKKAPSTKKS